MTLNTVFPTYRKVTLSRLVRDHTLSRLVRDHTETVWMTVLHIRFFEIALCHGLPIWARRRSTVDNELCISSNFKCRAILFEQDWMPDDSPLAHFN